MKAYEGDGMVGFHLPTISIKYVTAYQPGYTFHCFWAWSFAFKSKDNKRQQTFPKCFVKICGIFASMAFKLCVYKINSSCQKIIIKLFLNYCKQNWNYIFCCLLCNITSYFRFVIMKNKYYRASRNLHLY